MIKTKGLTHLNLSVKDIHISIKFYQEAFGMEVQFWAGDSMVFLNTPGSNDTFTLQQAKDGEHVGPGGGFGHFGVQLDEDDLDSAIKVVEAAGGVLLDRGEHPLGQPGLVQPYAFFKDFDGYVIEIYE